MEQQTRKSSDSSPDTTEKKESAKSIPKRDECRHLDLNTFKTLPCRIREPHLPKQCPYYHDAKRDRRRGPDSNYSSDMCYYSLKEKDCPYGDRCPKAHNRVEEFYHKSKYKTKFCSHYPDSLSECEYGGYCCFAHSEADIKIDLIHKMDRDIDFYTFHFKTVWCPFNEANHVREQCVYAHNWQDYRRKPHVYSYENMQCPNWDATKIINVYLDGCSLSFNCKLSHGWKEQEFHPLSYKTCACRNGEKCTRAHCPFYHTEKEKRFPVKTVFQYMPRNRVFTFYPFSDTVAQPAPLKQNMLVYQPIMTPMMPGSPMEMLHYSPVYGLEERCPTPPMAYSGYPRSNSPLTFYPDNTYQESPTGSISLVTESFVKDSMRLVQPEMPAVPYRQSVSISYKRQPQVREELKEKAELTEDTMLMIKREIDGSPDNRRNLLEFLKKHQLEHLYKKLNDFNIKVEDIRTLTKVSLEQLGILGEDQQRLLTAAL